jgi:hypothetical protein
VPLLFNKMILLRIAGSKVSSVRFKGFWGRGMTGTKVPLKIIPTQRTNSSGKMGDVPPADPPASPKPKLLDQLREALRSRHYSRRTEQTYLIYTHVLNRGPTDVRSPADKL